MTTVRINLASKCIQQLAPSNIEVTFDPSPEMVEFYGEHAFPLAPGDTCLYLGEVKNMPGRGMFTHTHGRKSTAAISVWHLDNFWYVVEDVTVVESKSDCDETLFSISDVEGCDNSDGIDDSESD